MKQISVIIPVYNAGSSIGNAVESLLAQSYDALEVILVDDGSKDGSAAVCDSLADAHECIRVLHKENGGVSSARNAGLDAATGEYVMFLDADDILCPGALQAMAVSDADMVMGGFCKVSGGRILMELTPGQDRTYYGVEGISSFFDDTIGEKDCYLLNSSCFKIYRRSLIEASGLRFDETMKYGEDKLFVFGLIGHAGSVSTISKVVYDYIVSDESLSSDVTSDRHVSQIFMLLERYIPVLETLMGLYPQSMRLKELYHTDVISRYVFRILTCFATGTSSLMTRDSMEILYGYMDADKALGFGSVRAGQMVNLILYRIGSVNCTMSFYSFTSRIFRYISRR